MTEAITSADSPVPAVGQVFSVVLLMSTIAVLAACVTQRLSAIRSWRRLQLTNYLLFAIYIDSFTFVFLTAVLTKGFNMNASIGICRGIILLCLFFYMTTKVLLYLFLVERAYIVRGRSQPRLKNKLYLFNCFGMIGVYVGIFILNFIFRFSYINDTGLCIVGMKRIAMIPLLSFEVLVNVYLTSLFLLPLRRLYSYKHKKNANLRIIAMRTFIGSCATLMSSVVNITVLLVLDGEPGWVCMMCCNSDILFSVLVLHWVTSVDKSRPTTSNQYRSSSRRRSERPYDGTVGTLTARRQSKGGVLATQQDDAEKQKVLVTTHIEADVEARHPNDAPVDRIAVTTERMTRVEFETDVIDEFSPSSTKVERRVASETSGCDDEISEEKV